MADQSTCLSPHCGITVEGNLTKCPQCGWMMRSPANIRMRGKALIGIGLFLILMMGSIALYVLPMILMPGVETASGTFTGSAGAGLLVVAVIAVLMLFGLLSVVGGIHMSSTGQPSRPFGRIALVVAGSVAVLAVVVEIVDVLLWLK